MSRKGWLIIGIYILILLLAGWFLFGNKLVPEKEIHYHAGFVVFQDNKKLDFSDIKYMHAKPCGDEEEDEHSPEEEQIEKAHLHDYVGDVVHVHREDSKWKDLFTNLKFTVGYSKATAYINGEKIDNFENQIINPYDSIVIFIGENDLKFIKDAVTKKYIMEVEKKGESC